MRKRNRNFRPKVQKGIGHLSDQIAMQERKIQLLTNTIDAAEQSHSLYMAALTNFLGHDIKNCVQSMDAILSAYSVSELTDDHIFSLKNQLNTIRQTIVNFSEMMPNADQSFFKLSTLIGTAESITKDLVKGNGIEFRKIFPREIELSVQAHYHSLLQVLHNLIINACTHLKGRSEAKLLLYASVDLDEKKLYLAVYDNGDPIPMSLQEKIFRFGYSTTGGSGIGLFHARYICNISNGSLHYKASDKSEYTKCFQVVLPIRNLDHE